MRLAAALLLCFVPLSGLAAPQAERAHVLHADRSDVSAPLTLLVAAPEEDEGEVEHGPGRVPHQVQAAPPQHDPVLQASVAPLLLPRTSTNFDGIGLGFLGVNTRPFEVNGVPPDPQGDVGPSHYVQIVNASFAVFGKDGRTVFGPIATRTLFAGFGGACEERGDGDGIVLYDPLADRWLIAQLANTHEPQRPYHVCVAVSRSGDPIGQWARYDYSYADFHDYPKLGVWPDGYYATYNTFTTPGGGDFLGIAYCAFDRRKMLAAEPAAQQCILIRDPVSGTTPADLDGSLPPPEGEPNTAVGFIGGSLALYRFHADWSDPPHSFVEPAMLEAAPFAEACFEARNGACIPQAGTSAPALDSLADRMMFRAAYRNLGSRRSLVVNHSVAVRNVAGVRWYEIRDPGGMPVLYQQGTYAPDDAYRWMGSAAIDRAGNIGLGFSISSRNLRPAIGYTGHAASDAPGEMGQGEAIAASSAGSQASSLRWGDYSSMSVDPADECTFWYTNQYIPADGVYNWRTRIFSFQLPGCLSSPDYAVWPADGSAAIGRGRTAAIALDTAALLPSAGSKILSLSAAELPAGVMARIEPTSVAPGQPATLTLTAASDAQKGPGQGYLIRATAEGATASAAGVLDVVDADFALKPDHTEASVAEGGSTRVRIDTQQLFGIPETITFSASVLRRDLSVRFEPPQIVAGESAYMLVSSIAASAPPNTTIAVRADAASVSHSALIRLRAVDSPPAEVSWPAEALAVRAQTGSGCGCSAADASWDSIVLLGLLATLRRRPTSWRRTGSRSRGAPPSTASP
jgi:hypothetical protein